MNGPHRFRVRSLALVVACVSLALASPASSQDTDSPRFYFGVREGESNPLTRANDVAGVSIGANIDRYLGFEFAVDGYEFDLETSVPGRGSNVGMLGLLPQVRLRHPFLNDRLVPYLLVGGGLGIAQINDANLPVQWTSGSLTSLRAAGSFGGGVEYFVSEDIAAGVEGKYLLMGSETYEAGGTKSSIDLNAGILTFGLRLFHSGRSPDPATVAARHAANRFYVNLRFGGALRRAGDVFPGIHTEPEQELFGSNFAPLYAVSVGTRLGPVLDLELSGSNYELRLGYPGGGTSEYAVFPILLQPRLHVPMPDPQVDPYVLLGVGVEIGEINDTATAGVSLEGNGPSVIGALGAGLDYFVSPDIAVGLEAKYLFSRGHTLSVDGGEALRGDLDSLFVSIGVRAFLFDF